MEQKSATVWSCPWWRVEEQSFAGRDGQSHRWYSALRPVADTVHILALTAAGMVPVLRQWRYPVQAWVWELPAGLCDVPGEPPEAAARRELLEETGYRAGNLLHLFRGTVSPGLTNELYNAYLALDAEQAGPGGGIGGEQLELHLMPWERLADFFIEQSKSGELVDSKILTHIYLAQAALARLGEQRS